MGCANSSNTQTYFISPTSYEEICLEIHNQKRDLHDSPHLLLNEELNKLAVECASKLSNNENSINYVYKDEFLGQNIYIYKGSKFDIYKILDEWYKEIKNYSANLNKFQKKNISFYSNDMERNKRNRLWI